MQGAKSGRSVDPEGKIIFILSGGSITGRSRCQLGSGRVADRPTDRSVGLRVRIGDIPTAGRERERMSGHSLTGAVRPHACCVSHAMPPQRPTDEGKCGWSSKETGTALKASCKSAIYLTSIRLPTLLIVSCNANDIFYRRIGRYIVPPPSLIPY